MLFSAVVQNSRNPRGLRGFAKRVLRRVGVSRWLIKGKILRHLAQLHFLMQNSDIRPWPVFCGALTN